MFRERLRETRESKNISQTEMANMLGIAVTTYRNYENTSREPNYDMLVNISKILDVSIDFLLNNHYNEKYDISKKAEKLSVQSIKELNDYIDYLIYKDTKKEN